MNAEMQAPESRNAPAYMESAITMVIIVVAIVAGASGGFLIAERQASLINVRSGDAGPSGQTAATPAAGAPEVKKPPARSAPAPATKEAAGRTAFTPVSREASLVGAIDFLQQENAATVKVEVSAAELVRAGRIHNPERIFIDLRERGRTAATMTGFLANREIRVDNPLLAGIRVSLWKSGVVRIVLDLKGSCEYSYRLSPDPSARLIVELRPAATVPLHY